MFALALLCLLAGLLAFLLLAGWLTFRFRFAGLGCGILVFFSLLGIARRVREVGAVLGDFAVELAIEGVEFGAGLTQGFGFVAEDAFGGALDAGLELFDFAAHLFLEFLGVVAIAAPTQLFRQFEGLRGVALRGGAQGVVEFLVEQGLGDFRLLTDAFHVLGDAAEFFLLLVEFFRELFALAAAIESAALGFVRLGAELVGDVLLILREFAGVAAHLAHLFVELAARFLAELIAQLVELPLCAGAIGERFGGLVALHGLGGLLGFAAGLLELLALLGELRLLR